MIKRINLAACSIVERKVNDRKLFSAKKTFDISFFHVNTSLGRISSRFQSESFCL